jgi:hypothetical protein
VKNSIRLLLVSKWALLGGAVLALLWGRFTTIKFID